MFSISKRRALLGLLFSFLAVQIVQASVDLRLLPKVEKNEQVNEEGLIEQIGIEIEWDQLMTQWKDPTSL
jgi:hypothetical protein